MRKYGLMTTCVVAMTTLLGAAPKLVATADAAIQTKYDPIEDHAIPAYRSGHLLTYDFSRAVVRAYSDNGKTRAFQTPIIIPGAKQFMIRRITSSPSGITVVSGTAASHTGQLSSLLVWISSNGQITKIVRTTPFAPMEIAFGPDGNLWAAGREYDDTFRELPEYSVLRSYSPDGRAISEALPRTSFATRGTPIAEAYLVSTMKALVLYSVTAGQVIEVGPSGQVLARTPVSVPADLMVTGFAAVPSIGYVISAQRSREKDPNKLRAVMFMTGPDKVPVVPVDTTGIITPQSGGYIIGVDADRIALFQSGSKLSWVRVEN